VYFRCEDMLSDDRDPKLKPFFYVGLEYCGAARHRLAACNISFAHKLCKAHHTEADMIGECAACKLAYNLPIVARELPIGLEARGSTPA
jgi:hypothetical protein